MSLYKVFRSIPSLYKNRIYSSLINLVIRKHDQIVNPYYFGEPHLKRTCLWLKNLPKLKYRLADDLFNNRTSVDRPEPIYTDVKGKKRYFTDANSGRHGDGESFKPRSKFWIGIAEAMADQWG